MALIEAKNIKKVFHRGKIDIHALRGISLEVERGEFLSIVGPSGSGKTTLMDILGCLSRPTSGSYYLDGQDISKLDDDTLSEIRNKKIGFVFQTFNLISRTNAVDNVELPLLYSRVPEGDRKEKALKALEQVGLGDRAYHGPNELSGGEQQRVAIARALINNPSIIFADEPTGNLDSKTGKEIMTLFEELHRQGKTIVVVTHDSVVAEHAKRSIKIKDGRIEKDIVKEKPAKEKVTAKEERRIDHSFLGCLISGFSSGYKGLLGNKLRSFLTVLGIVIGVGAVIGVMGVGEGAKRAVTSQIERLGSNVLSIYYRRPDTKEEALQWRGRSEGLTYRDAIAIKNECPAIVDVAPEVNTRSVIAKYQDKDWETEVVGTTPSYKTIRDHQVSEGRFFNEEDMNSWAKICTIGKTVKDELFGDENPIGKELKIRDMRFTIIGIMEEKGSFGWMDFDDQIFIPLFTVQKRFTGDDNIRSIQAKTTGSVPPEDSEAQVRDLLLKRHNQVEDFRIRNREEFKETIEETASTMKLMLAGIAAISLIVGGIGIMNIMLVSVTERTREIGIRKAIGAKRIDILIQFLIESVIVSLTGGIIGIILGVIFAGTLGNMMVGAGAMGGPRFLSQGGQSVVTLSSIFIAFFFAVVVGVFFGMYPANKASKLDPVVALRYE